MGRFTLIIILFVFFSMPGVIFGETTQKSPEAVFEAAEKAIVFIRGYGFDQESERGGGTGFIVDSEGIIVTNCHVVSTSKLCQVQLYDRRILPVESIIDYDAKQDYCILKINAENLPVIKLSDKDEVNIGEEIAVIGNPEFKRNVLSRGVITGTRDLSYMQYLESDVQTSVGNSGSPILNMRGEALGVVTIVSPMTLAVPISKIRPHINKKPKMGWLEFTKEQPVKSMLYAVKGERAYEAGDYDKAMENYQRALQLFPEHTPFIYGGVGNAYLRKGEFDKAISHFQAIVKNEPNFAGGYNCLSFAYNAKGEYDKAIEYAERALELSPKMAMAYCNFSMAYSQKGQYKKAIEYAERALELSQKAAPWAYYSLAFTYCRTGAIDKAIEHAEKAVEADPNHAEANFVLGLAYWSGGDVIGLLGQMAKLEELDRPDLAQQLRDGFTY